MLAVPVFNVQGERLGEMEIDPAANVVLCSGYSLEGEASELLKKGARGYIQKPFSIGELGEIFSGMLRDE